ncbi:MAG: hemerythrin family protein [Oscillospiraceae bacterium]|nr:hemerythrin family protein [Oscillospiraceae bacterium]
MTYWKDSLLVGVPKIDGQHKKLVGAIDELMAACKKGQGREKIDPTLAFVISYTKEHFTEEERLQAEYAYPGMIAHKRLHAQFLASVSALVKEYEQTGPSIALVGKLNKSLVDWVINHITVEDKKVGEYIQSRRA